MLRLTSSLFDKFLCLEISAPTIPESPSKEWCTVVMFMTLLVSASYSAPGFVMSCTDFTLVEERSDNPEVLVCFLPSI